MAGPSGRVTWVVIGGVTFVHRIKFTSDGGLSASVSIFSCMTLLLLGKVWEYRPNSIAARRVLMLAASLTIGIAGWTLADFFSVELGSDLFVSATPAWASWFSGVQLKNVPAVLAWLVALMGLFGVLRWWHQVDPARKTHLSLRAVSLCFVWALIFSYILGQPITKYCVLAIVVSISVQLAAPRIGFQDRRKATGSSLPSWIEKEHWQEDGADVVVVKTEGFITPEHAIMVLVDLVRKEVGQEIDVLVHAGASDLVSLPDSYVEANLVQDELILDSKQLDPSFAGKKKFYGFAKLHFSPAFREMVEKRYQRNFRTGRLTWTGVMGAAALGWLAVAWAYLRLDQVTRHFYSRRLQTVTR